MQQDEKLMWKYYHQWIYIFNEKYTDITSVRKAKKQNISLGF